MGDDASSCLVMPWSNGQVLHRGCRSLHQLAVMPSLKAVCPEARLPALCEACFLSDNHRHALSWYDWTAGVPKIICVTKTWLKLLLLNASKTRLLLHRMIQMLWHPGGI